MTAPREDVRTGPNEGRGNPSKTGPREELGQSGGAQGGSLESESKFTSEQLRPPARDGWRRYVAAFILTGIAAFLHIWFLGGLQGRVPFVTFYPAVILAALYGGLRGGLAASALATALVALWREPLGPRFIHGPEDWIGVAMFVAGCVMISILCEVLHQARVRAAKLEMEAQLQSAVAAERERAEASARQLKLIIEGMEDGFVALDRQWRYRHVNPAGARLLHRKPEELLGRSLWEVFPDATRLSSYEQLHRAMEEGAPVAFEHYIPEKQAWYESRSLPTPEGLIVFFSDVSERKNAEIRLRESEERFRLLMDEAKDYAILMLDTEGRLTCWNAGAERLVGYTEQEILGQSFSRFYTPGDIAQDKPGQELKKAAAQGRVEYEGWRLRRDGSTFWANVVMTALHDKAGQLIGFSKLVRDATERRRVETERNRFVSLAENSTEFIGMCDLSYKPFFVNKAGIRLVGLDNVQQALAVEVKDFFFPEDQPFIYEQFFPEVLRQGHAEKEIRFRHFKTGATLWVLYNVFTLTGAEGKSIGFATVSLDITERKRVEEALQHSEELHRIFFDLGAVGMAYASPEGRLLKVNDKYCEITGYSRSELDGFPVLELTHPDDRGTDRAVYDAYIRGELRVYASEKRYIRKDRSVRWVAVNARMVREADGRARYSLGIIEDITERKRAEENLCHARDKLARLNVDLERRVAERTALLEESLQSLEGVLYHVAHDLRAPLRAMHSFTDLLLEEYARTLDARGENYAQRIRDAAGRMDRLIQDLLNYGRLGHQVVVWASVDLMALVEGVLKDLRHDILTTKAELQVDAPLPKVRGDAQILEQVLNNLVCNALKFVAPGIRPRIRIWAETFGSTVRLNIQDNGIGIAPEYHERIFRMFERLHEANSIYPGTGIGLAIVRKGIDRLAGRVGVESQVGAGSCFWLELQRADL